MSFLKRSNIFLNALGKRMDKETDMLSLVPGLCFHDDVIKWKHFHVTGPLCGELTGPGELTFSLICARINGWVNNSKAGNLRRYRTHYDVIVMQQQFISKSHNPGLSCISIKSLQNFWSYDILFGSENDQPALVWGHWYSDTVYWHLVMIHSQHHSICGPNDL